MKKEQPKYIITVTVEEVLPENEGTVVIFQNVRATNLPTLYIRMAQEQFQLFHK